MTDKLKLYREILLDDKMREKLFSSVEGDVIEYKGLVFSIKEFLSYSTIKKINDRNTSKI